MRSISLASFVVPALLAGCVTSSGDLGETDQNLLLNLPTGLSLYESANETGITYTASLAASDSGEAMQLVSTPDLTTAGLLGKVSSVRLSCGPRAARLVLFDAYNSSDTTFSDWSHALGNGATIECQPYRTTVVDLHVDFPTLADRVGSAMLVTQAANFGFKNFSLFLEPAWTASLNLPSGATATTHQIWLSTLSRFEIRQFLTIDALECTKRGAVFEYSVEMNPDHTFTATVVDSYVDYGFGDAWGCHDTMKSKLDAALAGGRAKLQDGVKQIVDAFAPNMALYYFLPNATLTQFDLAYEVPVTNAP
jgi:hypothetical protein